jgi:hypothetical protein
MLFQSQMDEVLDIFADEKLFFLGTTLKPLDEGEKILRVTGVKLRDGNIRTEVTYSFPLIAGMVVDKPFSKVLEPAVFDRFLNDVAGNISKAEPRNKLVDLPLTNMGVSDVKLLTKEQAWELDLIFLAASGEYEQTRSGFAIVAGYLDDIARQQMKPNELRKVLIEGLKRKGVNL